MKKLVKFMSTLLIGVLVLAGCGTATSNGDKILRTALSAKPITLNHLATSLAIDFDQIAQVMEGLVEYDKDNKIIGAAAKDWKVSEDNMTYTFNLQKNAVWTNGDPVTAHDFVYGFKLLAAQDTAPYRFFIEILKNGPAILKDEADADTLGVQAIDDHTLEVTVEKPTAMLLDYLAFPVFFPMNQKAFESIGFDAYGKSADATVSNGAFSIKDFQPEVSVDFIKNETYWNKGIVKLDGVSVKVVPDLNTQSVMFESGDIDILDVRSTLTEQYQGYKNLIPYVQAGRSYFYMSNNTSTPEPVLGNQNFRLAVAHAFDKTVLTDSILKDGSVALDTLVPTEFGKVNGKSYLDYVGKRDIPTFNTTKAQEYLTKAKAELGDTPLTFKLTFADTATGLLVYENVKSQIETNLPGVTVELNSTPQQLLYPEIKAFKVPAGVAGWGPDYFDYSTFFTNVQPGSSYNYARYEDPEVTALLEKAESAEFANDPKGRADLYSQAEVIILNSGNFIPMYQPGGSYAVKDNVEGVVRGAISPTLTYKRISMK